MFVAERVRRHRCYRLDISSQHVAMSVKTKSLLWCFCPSICDFTQRGDEEQLRRVPVGRVELRFLLLLSPRFVSQHENLMKLTLTCIFCLASKKKLKISDFKCTFLCCNESHVLKKTCTVLQTHRHTLYANLVPCSWDHFWSLIKTVIYLCLSCVHVGGGVEGASGNQDHAVWSLSGNFQV